MSQYHLRYITFSDHTLDVFIGTGDSITENQTHTAIGSSSVLVMHRPDIRQEPEESERKREDVKISGKKTTTYKSIHSNYNSLSS